MKTFAVIPTKWVDPQSLAELILSLSTDESIESIYVLDNKHVFAYKIMPEEPKLKWLNGYGLTIYEMWNLSWRMLREEYPKEELNIAFLNDDIKIHPTNGKYLDVMAEFLRFDKDLGAVYPDYDKTDTPLYSIRYTNTTAGAGGMSGYCFMLKGELEIPYVDEAFQLYWGDDDLVKQIIRAGYKIGRVVGLPIDHVGSQTIKTLDATDRLKIMEKDRQYFNQKYNENRGPVW